MTQGVDRDSSDKTPAGDPKKRFAFGQNWQSFRKTSIDEAAIRQAERGLHDLFGEGALRGRSFLDIGSGSGLSSLAAHRAGASRVVSFDYDPDSVACTRALRDEHGIASDVWDVRQGSVLDDAVVRAAGPADVVYSWGVLHHTGDMWRAIDNAITAVAPGGLFAIAIYNRVEGRLGTLSSDSWRAIKLAYVEASPRRRELMLAAFAATRVTLMLSELSNPYREIVGYKHDRGMSWMHDLRDWIGGYPYEYATAEELQAHAAKRGFTTKKLIPVLPNGLGNNQIVFERKPAG